MSDDRYEVDTLLIGSSPFMIFEAIRLKMGGQKVLVVDKSNVIGGAWYTKELHTFKGVEIGCHFISNNAETYRFIETLLEKTGGKPLVKMEPQPFILYKGFHFRRDSYIPHIRRGMYFSFKRKTWFDFWAFIKTFSIRMYREFIDRFKNYPFKYPNGGCQDMMDCLNVLVEKFDIPILFETTVESVIINASKSSGTSELSKGSVSFKHIAVSSCSNLSNLVIGDEFILIDKEQHRQHHLVMHLRGKRLKDFTYFDMTDQSYVIRGSDVGKYCQEFKNKRKENEYLICVQIHESKWQEGVDISSVATPVLDHLKHKGFFAADGELLNAWHDDYEFKVIKNAELERLEKIAAPVLQTTLTLNLEVRLGNFASNSWTLALGDCVDEV